MTDIPDQLLHDIHHAGKLLEQAGTALYEDGGGTIDGQGAAETLTAALLLQIERRLAAIEAALSRQTA